MLFLLITLIVINALLIVALLVATDGKFSRLRDQLIGKFTRFFIRYQLKKERKQREKQRKQLPAQTEHKPEVSHKPSVKQTEAMRKTELARPQWHLLSPDLINLNDEIVTVSRVTKAKKATARTTAKPIRSVANSLHKASTRFNPEKQGKVSS